MNAACRRVSSRALLEVAVFAFQRAPHLSDRHLSWRRWVVANRDRVGAFPTEVVPFAEPREGEACEFIEALEERVCSVDWRSRRTSPEQDRAIRALRSCRGELNAVHLEVLARVNEGPAEGTPVSVVSAASDSGGRKVSKRDALTLLAGWLRSVEQKIEEHLAELRGEQAREWNKLGGQAGVGEMMEG